jgi:PPK2 family polyphosphate:nucleotide phosphotransferase
MAKLVRDRLRVPPGPVQIADLASDTTPGFRGSKQQGKQALSKLGSELADLQERLFAEGQTGGRRSLLLVLQGMDTSGKGGTLRHSVGLVDPQGVRIKSFKAPTPEEKRHDFLWRVRRELPPPGYLGIFDRSHYEDVLVVRVHGLVPRATWSRRYATINRFEAQLAERGTTVVKCFLHISKKEQKRRLRARLEDPTKHWKYNPDDISERRRWDDYQLAYQDVLEKTNTEAAPWHVVPSDHKWYRNWAITHLLLEHLRDIDPRWPVGDFDVAAQKAQLASS